MTLDFIMAHSIRQTPASLAIWHVFVTQRSAFQGDKMKQINNLTQAGFQTYERGETPRLYPGLRQ